MQQTTKTEFFSCTKKSRIKKRKESWMEWISEKRTCSRSFLYLRVACWMRSLTVHPSLQGTTTPVCPNVTVTFIVALSESSAGPVGEWEWCEMWDAERRCVRTDQQVTGKKQRQHNDQSDGFRSYKFYQSGHTLIGKRGLFFCLFCFILHSVLIMITQQTALPCVCD